MTMRMHEKRVAAALALALLLSACASVGGGDRKSTTTLYDRLPESVRRAGAIKVGSSFTAEPVIFRNAEGKPDGLDVALAAAMEPILGVRFDFQDAGQFASVLPGLEARKYDIAMSGITDSPDRQHGLDKDGSPAGQGVDFIDYFMAGIGVTVRKGNPARISGIEDLCGHGVAVKKGTTHHDFAARQEVACRAAGKNLRIVATDSDAQAIESLRGGTSDAYITDYPKAMHNVRSAANGQVFEMTGGQLHPKPYGIAVRKTDPALRDALLRAVTELVISGTYDRILDQWQLSSGAIQNPVVNGGTN